MSKGLKEQIVELVKDDLEKVEKALEDNLTPNVDLVKTIAAHLLFSGGKRLRPLLMIHCARMCGYSGGFEIKFSTIFEYLHAATLLHDDVVDEADVRRGKNAAHTQWSAPKVVLTGDFLLALALNLSAKTKEPEIISVMAHITAQMSQGEIDQMERKGDLGLTQEEYFKVIERKTAVLIQGACESGAILAKVDKEKQTALKDYGYHIGMAFQMADDLLDYLSTAEELGKNPGADMREGKLTLPLIHSLSRASDTDRAWMETVITKNTFDPDEFGMLKEKLIQYNGIEYTRNLAAEHVEKAKACLSRFKESDSKRLLMMIADYSLKRKV